MVVLILCFIQSLILLLVPYMYFIAVFFMILTESTSQFIERRLQYNNVCLCLLFTLPYTNSATLILTIFINYSPFFSRQCAIFSKLRSHVHCQSSSRIDCSSARRYSWEFWNPGECDSCGSSEHTGSSWNSKLSCRIRSKLRL